MIDLLKIIVPIYLMYYLLMIGYDYYTQSSTNTENNDNDNAESFQVTTESSAPIKAVIPEKSEEKKNAITETKAKVTDSQDLKRFKEKEQKDKEKKELTKSRNTEEIQKEETEVDGKPNVYDLLKTFNNPYHMEKTINSIASVTLLEASTIFQTA